MGDGSSQYGLLRWERGVGFVYEFFCCILLHGYLKFGPVFVAKMFRVLFPSVHHDDFISK